MDSEYYNNIREYGLYQEAAYDVCREAITAREIRDAICTTKLPTDLMRVELNDNFDLIMTMRNGTKKIHKYKGPPCKFWGKKGRKK